MKKLSIISLLFYFSYIVSLLLAYPLGSYISPFIGWFFLGVIVLLALIGVFTIYLVKDNYEAEEEGSPELFSLGETLISVTLQLLFRTLYKTKKRDLNIAKEWQNSFSVEVAEEYLSILYNGVEQKISWGEIVAYSETKDNIILYLSPRTLDIIILMHIAFQ